MAAESQNRGSSTVAASYEANMVPNCDNLEYKLYSICQILESARQQTISREQIYHRCRMENQALRQEVSSLQEKQEEIMSNHTVVLQNQEEMLKINQTLECQLEEAEEKAITCKQKRCQLIQNASLDSAQIEGLEQVVEQQARELQALKGENERLKADINGLETGAHNHPTDDHKQPCVGNDPSAGDNSLEEKYEKIRLELVNHFPSLLDDVSNLSFVLGKENGNSKKKRRRPSS